MELDEYQKKAQLTDQFPDVNDDGASLTIPILGIIGELGSLVTCFKKRIRDGESYEHFILDLREEIGDVLWYVANLASKWDLSLNEIAKENLDKAEDRWVSSSKCREEYIIYDQSFPAEEQLPRKLLLRFEKNQNDEAASVYIVDSEGNENKIGDTLTDNSYVDDLYRFHDVFHLSYAAILGWSPVLRDLLNIKRKSSPQVDEVEDGARARITEEAISLYIFSYAKRHYMLENLREIDLDVLSTIRNLVSGFEVKDRTLYEWRLSILKGYEVYRKLNRYNGGYVKIDLLAREISFLHKL
ncbi:MAG: nucleoside triphosphate pyrophosphohydrolase family protein [Cyanobacteria bacterium P01_D01_bin.156]